MGNAVYSRKYIWFNNIPEKDHHSFIAFDIVNFYPSISHKLLNDALSFAASYADISAEDRNIIFHTKQSLRASWIILVKPELMVQACFIKYMVLCRHALADFTSYVNRERAPWTKGTNWRVRAGTQPTIW